MRPRTPGWLTAAAALRLATAASYLVCSALLAGYVVRGPLEQLAREETVVVRDTIDTSGESSIFVNRDYHGLSRNPIHFPSPAQLPGQPLPGPDRLPVPRVRPGVLGPPVPGRGHGGGAGGRAGAGVPGPAGGAGDGRVGGAHGGRAAVAAGGGQGGGLPALRLGRGHVRGLLHGADT